MSLLLSIQSIDAELMLMRTSYLKVPYCTIFWSFVLGFDVLKNIYLRYKYQKPSQYIYIYAGCVYFTVD